MKHWPRDGLEVVLSVAAAVSLAASGVFGGHVGLFGWLPSANAVLLAIGAVLLIPDALLIARRGARLHQLEDEHLSLLERAAMGEAVPLRLMRDELKALSRQAKHASTERVSLYRHEADGFTLIGRYSACPPFDESLGREVLPEAQGALGEAWANARAFRTDLPAAGQNTSPPNKQWLQAQERYWQIGSELATAFKMRSQYYAAFRIATASGDGQGAIVFESTVRLSDARSAAKEMLMEEGELDNLVKEASPRLRELIRVSQVLDRGEIRRLLNRQQGPSQVGSV